MAITAKWFGLISRLERTRLGNALIGMSPLLGLLSFVGFLIYLDMFTGPIGLRNPKLWEHEQAWRAPHNLAVGCLKNGKVTESLYWFNEVANGANPHGDLRFKALLNIAAIYKAAGNRESYLTYIAKAMECKPLLREMRHETQMSGAHRAALPVPDEGIAWFNTGARYGAMAAVEVMREGKTTATAQDIAYRAAILRQIDLASEKPKADATNK